jgi:HD domain
MSKTISEIYTEYKIMPSLQMHMLRVAAVASLICDNFEESLDKEDVIAACLLHDMGNIIKFKFNVPEFLAPEGLEYWEKVQKEFRNKYNTDSPSVATNEIVKEIGVSDKVFNCINTISFLGAKENVETNDFNRKISAYSDDRVTPYGVVSLEERLADLRNRYDYRGGDTPERRNFEESIRQVEKQIFVKCKIKPEDITDEAVAPIIEKLKDFVIK